MIIEEKTLSSERIYEGTIVNLRKDRVTIKNGGVSYREIVEHAGGVVILGVTEEGKIPIVRQYRKATRSVMLELPAGKLERGEDPREAALRELKEETGYTAENIRLISWFYPTVGYSEEILYVFFAENLTAGETDFDIGEAIDIEEYLPDILFELIETNEIHDGKTLIALLLYKNSVPS
jgi:ADP-ribose pyrophosphatase